MGSDKPAEGAVTPPSADGGVTPEMQQAIQKVVMGIFKDAMPRMIEQSITKSVPTLLDKIAEQAIADEPADPTKGNPADGQEKLTLKALNEQIARLTQGIETERKARTEAENRARDIRRNSSIEAEFARHIGADSPHLKPYTSFYLQQFEERDGVVGRKTAGEYGEERFIPLKDAVEELFKGELKSILPNKAAQLPASGLGRLNGQPINQQPRNGQQRANPLLMEMANMLAETRPEAAQIIADDAVKIPVPTPRK